jgi:hypothetical protein
MGSIVSLGKRLAALEGRTAFLPFCWLRAAPREETEHAIARHAAEVGCHAEAGRHVVWRMKL